LTNKSCVDCPNKKRCGVCKVEEVRSFVRSISNSTVREEDPRDARRSRTERPLVN